MGLTYARELNWEQSQKSFERALELNPSLTRIHTNYAVLTLLPLGKVRRAQQLLEAALITDPVSLGLRVELAMAQITAGRYDDAIANLRHVVAADPKWPGAPRELARALMFAGRPVEAITVWENRPDSQGDWERWLAPAYVILGRRAEVERMVEAHENEHPYRQTLVYAALGDKDRTFEALNRAIDLMPQRTALLLTHPEMAFLGGDPRLDALRKRLKLP
jgi:tetratricopeptide (TPR) repeat protein